MRAVYRLKKNASYDYVYKKGTSIACREFVLVAVKVKGDSLKAGFSISKKIGKAVIRNKVRRRMKASFHALIPKLDTGYHMVFIARSGIENVNYATICKSMNYILAKYGIKSKSENLASKSNVCN